MGDADYRERKSGSVLNESAVFAFNARTAVWLNWSKTVKLIQVKYHLGIEFTAHFWGNSLCF
jgi:hypothetical protein